MIANNKTSKRLIIWFLLFGLSLLSIGSCLNADSRSDPRILPTNSNIVSSNTSGYNFSLEKNFGKGIVEAADWAPDGGSFALATSVQVDIFDAQALEVIITIDTGQWNKSITYSPDGKLLAVGEDDGTIQIWDLQSQKLIRTFTSTDSQLYYGSEATISFSGDGQKLVSVLDQTLWIWDMSTGALLDSFPGHMGGIGSVAISPDKNIVLAAGSGGIYVRDLSTRELLYPPIESKGEITSIYFDPDAKQFYTISSKYVFDDKSLNSSYLSYIRTWNLSSGELLDEHLLKEHTQINSTDINPEQHSIILGEETGISIWDISTQQSVFSMQGQTARLQSIAISPDGKRLVSVGSHFVSGDGAIQLWDLTSKQIIKTFDEYSVSPLAVVFSPNEKLAAVTSANQIVQIVDTNSGQILHTLEGGMPLAFSPDGKSMAFSRKDYFLVVNTESEGFPQIADFPCSGVSAIAFSQDGSTIAFGGDECDLQLRDIQSGNLVRNLSKVAGNNFWYFENLTFSTDGMRLALGGYGTEILDIQSGKLIHQDNSGIGFHEAAFSPDGRYLAISGYGGYGDKDLIQVWDVASDQIAINIRTLQNNVTKLIFSPNGRTLMIAGDTIELWDIWTGQPLAGAELFKRLSVRIMFSLDGQSLIIAQEDGSIQHWRIQSNSQLTSGIQSTPTFAPTATTTPVVSKIELNQVAELGKGESTNISRSPDGRIAAFIEKNVLKWFSTRTFKELGVMEIERAAGRVTISPNNKFAIVGGFYGAQIVDLENRKIVGQVFGGNGPSFGYTFSQDSQFLAYTMGDSTTGGPYYSIGLWDTVRKTDAFTGYDYFPTILNDRYHTMSAPAISPNGKLVAAGHSDKHVYIWDLHTGETKFILEGHGAGVSSVDFSPNGRLLASGSLDGTIRLWDPSTGKLIRVVTGFTDDIADIQFTPDGQSIKVSVHEQTELLVDLSSDQIKTQPTVNKIPDPFDLHQYQQGFSTGDSSIFSEVLFSPDGKILAMASQNVLIWDISSQKLISFLDNSSGGVIRGMVFNSDGLQLAVTTSEDDVLVWNTKTGERLFSQKSNFLSGLTVMYAVGDSSPGLARGGSSILSEQGIAFSPKGNLLAYGNGNVIEIWDVLNSEKVAELINPSGYFATQLSYSKDGMRLYAISNRNRVAQVWDINEGKLIRQVKLTDVNANAYSAIALMGPLFARNNSDDEGNGWIELWNLDDGNVRRINAASDKNEPIVLSSDGSLLVSINGGNLNCWKTATGQLVHQTLFDFSPHGLAISQDNQIMAVSHNGVASIFNFTPIVQLAVQSNLPPLMQQVTATPIIYSWPTPTAVPTSIQPPETTANSDVINTANASQVQEMSRFSKGTIDQVNWSSAGDSIFISGSLEVSQYALASSNKQFTKVLERDQTGWVSDTALLPNGHLISASIDSGRVIVKDITTGKVLANLEGDGEPALSQDGSLLVYINPDGVLEVWDLLNNMVVTTLKSYSLYSIHPVFSPNGQWVAAVQTSYSRIKYADSIRMWNIHTGEIVNSLAGPDNDITDLSFTPDGQFLVGAAGGAAWIWEMNPSTYPEKLELYQAEVNGNLNIYQHTVTAATLSPDNQILAVGTSEHTLKLYDRKTQGELLTLTGHASSIRLLRFSPDGHHLISVDQDGFLILWDTKSGKQIATLDDHSGPLGGLLYRSDGHLAVWGQGTVWNIDPINGKPLHTIHIDSGSILAASPSGNLLAVYNPFSVSLLDANTGKLIQKLEGEAEDPFVEYFWEGLVFRGFYAASFSPDSNYLATAGTGGIWYYDTQNRRLLQQFPGNNTRKINFSPDGKLMLTALHEQAWPMSVLDVQSGKVVFSVGESGRSSDHPQSVFSPDGRWVGTIQIQWDKPDELIIYNADSQQIYKSLQLEDGISSISLTVNPSGTLVAIGQVDGNILLVDLTEQEILTKLTGHHGAVQNLMFSPDGRYLISGSSDGTVRRWGLR